MFGKDHGLDFYHGRFTCYMTAHLCVAFGAEDLHCKGMLESECCSSTFFYLYYKSKSTPNSYNLWVFLVVLSGRTVFLEGKMEK